MDMRLRGSAEFRIAAAARMEILRSLELHGRIPDFEELARAIEPTLREEIERAERLAEIEGEVKSSRQHNLVLERIISSSSRF